MSQLNFFMTQDELLLKLEDLLSTKLVTFFGGSSYETKKPIPIYDLKNLVKFDRIILWVNKDLIEPQCSLRGQGNYKNHYLFDHYKDPIIELDNCIYSNKTILPGRLFYKADYIDNETLRKLHKNAASKIVRLFNKNLMEISKPFKISATVMNLIQDDFHIELGQGGRIIDKTNINCT